jgi:polyferredoxin
MLALRPTAEKCSRCTLAACYRGSAGVAGCPVFEFPKTMTSNALCNVCANCIKTCPNDSPRLTLRLPTSELWFVRKPRLEEAFLAVVIMGIVFVQNVTMLDMWKSILAGLERLVGTSNYAVNFTITFLVAMALPVLLLGGAALIARRFNHDSLLDNFTKFGYAIIPLDVAGHVAHNLFHLLAEGKSILYTALALLGSPVAGLSPALASPGLIQALQYGLLALGLAASLYAAHRIARQHFVPGHQHWGSVAIYGALLVLLGAINFWLFASPMAMRM